MGFVIDESVEIGASADVVWGVLTDFAAYGEWNPFVLECRTTLRPGEPIDMLVQLTGPHPRRQREFIRSHTPGTEFAYTMKPVPAGALHSLRTQRLTPIDDEHCRYTSHFELNGWLRPVVSAALGAAMRRGFAGMTAGLRERAEKLA
ncbi:SRPBCC domain-containing protein [Nocardia sp. alder85J]|uniref:SRPBCC domain-containing protein n=1 Tax=Nocardia sp. alder85J TaxID=2862949 RepID=UPI001CD7AE8D|nr:SRPBCC domain-containing protein [Nocardia sp. alder85J]MCX4091856.1 SRPBCC domain-containing protein [Nocardia sp. alder85J]